MFKKNMICLIVVSFSCFIASCHENSNYFSRKDCQNGVGYSGYLKGYYVAKNYLQRTVVNTNEVYGYCYMQGYFDALG